MNQIEWTYWLAYASGLVLVILVSLEVFNEPSYKKKEPGLYKKFRPRDVTSNRLYFRSLSLYLASMGFLYTVISSSTDLGSALIGGKEVSSNLARDPVYPLLAATIVVGFQSAWYIKEVEKRLRSWLHRWAKIPQGARKTIDDLRRSKFVFDEYMKPGVLDNPDNPEFKSLADLDLSVLKSDFEKKWAKICCVVYSLRTSRETPACPAGGVDSTCYNDHFFDEYDDEWKAIISLHRGLANAISRYWEMHEYSSKKAADLNQTRDTIMEDLHFLQERLYAFIACAVRSRQPSESEVATALNKFGFRLLKEEARPVDLLAIINTFGFSAVLVLIGVHVAGWYFAEFSPWDLQDIRYVPQTSLDKFFWPVATFLYHGTAVWVALCYRKRRIRKNRWEAWEGNSPSRPHLSYIWAAVLGALAGYLVLVVLGMIDLGMRVLMKQELNFLHELLTVLLSNFAWIFLGAISAWSAVYYRDTPVEELTLRRRLLIPLVQGLVMGLVGYVSTEAYTGSWLFFNDTKVPAGFEDLNNLNTAYALFLGTLLFLIGAFMGYYFPKRKVWLSRKIFDWLGTWEMSQEDGEIFSITLEPDNIARTDFPGRGSGYWSVACDRVRIKWESGWIDYISRGRKRYMKQGFDSEASVQSPPSHCTPVAKAINLKMGHSIGR